MKKEELQGLEQGRADSEKRKKKSGILKASNQEKIQETHKILTNSTGTQKLKIYIFRQQERILHTSKSGYSYAAYQVYLSRLPQRFNKDHILR